MKGLAIVNAILIGGNLVAALAILALGKAVLWIWPEASQHIWPWFIVGLGGVAFALWMLAQTLNRSRK